MLLRTGESMIQAALDCHVTMRTAKPPLTGLIMIWELGSHGIERRKPMRFVAGLEGFEKLLAMDGTGKKPLNI